MNPDLTIILLIKDRPNFVLRWLKYHNENPPSFPVIITDSGTDDTIENILKDRSVYPHIRYTYVRYSRPTQPGNFGHVADLNQKIHAALRMVKTKYAVLESDDDFNLDDGLLRAVNFLNAHPEYVVSRGEVYDFRIRGKDAPNKAENVYGTLTGARRIYTNPSNTGKTALARALEFSEYSDSLWLDVSRTDELTRAYETLLNSNIVDRDTGASLVSYLLVAEGKVHRGEGLYILHQSHLGGWAHALLQINPLETVLSESWPKDITIMFDIVAARIAEHDGISVSSVRYKIMQYYIYYMLGGVLIGGRVSRQRTNKVKPSRIFSLSNMLSKNNKIRIFLKQLYENIREHKEEARSNAVIKSSGHQPEFEKIRNFLLKK